MTKGVAYQLTADEKRSLVDQAFVVETSEERDALALAYGVHSRAALLCWRKQFYPKATAWKYAPWDDEVCAARGCRKRMPATEAFCVEHEKLFWPTVGEKRLVQRYYGGNLVCSGSVVAARDDDDDNGVLVPAPLRAHRNLKAKSTLGGRLISISMHVNNGDPIDTHFTDDGIAMVDISGLKKPPSWPRYQLSLSTRKVTIGHLPDGW